MAVDPQVFASDFDLFLTRLVPFGFSGALLISLGEEMLVRKGYGLADRESGTPNSPETVFSLGSITKQFTAAAIMKLAEMGRLDPQDRLGKFVSGVPGDKAGITLHHLLTHTAGLLNYTGDDYEAADQEHVLHETLAAPLQFGPGEYYAYSNAGYSMLAAIVEIVSGMPYERFLHEYLLVPAGLKDTGYLLPDWSGQTMARWYAGGTDNGHALEKIFPSWNIMGNGEMLSTLDDMLRWHQALSNGGVLSDKSQAKMYAPFLRDYGYGWRIVETKIGRLVEHNGASDLGTSALFRRYMDAGLAVILFCNQSYGELPMVLPLQEKLDLLLAGEAVSLPPMIVGEPEPVDAFTGRYELPSGGAVLAREEGGRLVLAAEEQDAINLLAFPDLPLDAHADLNARTLAAFSDAAGGDFEGLLDFMANAEQRAPAVRRMVANNLEQAKTALGPLQTIDLAGTVPSSIRPGALDTVIRLGFEKGSAGILSVSQDGLNVGVAVLEISQAFVMPAVPHSAGLDGYHLPLGREMRLEALKAPGGEVYALRVGKGTLTAHKQPG